MAFIFTKPWQLMCRCTCVGTRCTGYGQDAEIMNTQQLGESNRKNEYAIGGVFIMTQEFPIKDNDHQISRFMILEHGSAASSCVKVVFLQFSSNDKQLWTTNKMERDDDLTLNELRKVPGKNGKINVLQQISTKYTDFGIVILKDDTGAIVSQIAQQYRGNAEDINREIVRRWLGGAGIKEKTWKTLVEVLEDIELNILAADIKEVKCQTDGRRRPQLGSRGEIGNGRVQTDSAEGNGDVFISYKWKDGREFADQTASQLKKKRFSVWIDDRQMAGGDDLWNSIEKGIHGCKVFVPILTKAYVTDEGGWCESEVKLAAKLRKEIVPVFLGISELPPGMGYQLILEKLVQMRRRRDEEDRGFIERICGAVLEKLST